MEPTVHHHALINRS